MILLYVIGFCLFVCQQTFAPARERGQSEAEVERNLTGDRNEVFRIALCLYVCGWVCGCVS